MKVRRPKINFESSLPHWSHHHEFAQAFNAASTTLPHLEPYLNRVVLMAIERLTPADAVLIEETKLFIEQESNHYRLHRRYNETLYRAGYAGLRAHEARLKADYDRFLATKPLRFNLAYSEGFECMGIIYTTFFFERVDDLLQGAESAEAAKLWKWHLAEEFEHRTVCYDLYERLFGSYWYRIYGFLYAFVHLSAYGTGATAYMIGTDRASMTARERWASRWRNGTYQLRLLGFAVPRLLQVLSPWYNPRSRREPRGMSAFLEALT